MTKVPINKFPIFHQYLYEFIKNYIDSSCSFDFISQNIYITGYCQCGLKGCATVQLQSKINFPNYQKTTSICNDNIIQKLHLDGNFFIREFEYIDRSSTNEVSFKKEITAMFKES